LSFQLDPDVPGDAGIGATVSELIDTAVLIIVSDFPTLSGVFMDDWALGAGLSLELRSTPVPEPTSVVLGAGLPY